MKSIHLHEFNFNLQATEFLISSVIVTNQLLLGFITCLNQKAAFKLYTPAVRKIQPTIHIKARGEKRKKEREPFQFSNKTLNNWKSS